MPEKLSNLGYLKIGKETTGRGVAVIPTVDVPLYSETIFPNTNLQTDNPIIGNPFAVYNIFPGQRDHNGDIEVMCEPRTLPHFLNMLLSKTSSTANGAGVNTHLFNLASPNQSNSSYTIDLLKGDIVHRFYGCEIETLTPVWKNDSYMTMKLAISALGQVSVVSIASGATTTITLGTEYDPSPASGLVVGDVITVVHMNNGVVASKEDTTITAISTDGLTLTVTSMTGTYVAGDQLYIKARSVSPNISNPFNWSRTEFRFGITAAAALNNAHTPLEKSTSFELMNNLEDKGGARRSGDYDPVSLVRKQGNASLTAKKFLNDGSELNDFLRMVKKACVIRMFGNLISGTTFNEFRVTFNNMKLMSSPDPLKSGEIIYVEQKFQPQYDTTDGQAFSVSVVNDISSYVTSTVPSSVSPSASASPSPSKSPSSSPSPSTGV